MLLVNSEEPNQEMHDVDEPNDRIPESMEPEYGYRKW